MGHVKAQPVFADRDAHHYEFLLGAVLFSDIFLSTVGFMPDAGMPAIFIRLAGCNRGSKAGGGCVACPTDFRFEKGQMLPYAEILVKVNALVPRSFKEAGERPPVFITGGEPMMQLSVVGLIEMLTHAGYGVRVESNGDTLVHGFLESEACKSAALYVSPKSGPRPDRRVLGRADRIRLLIEDNADDRAHYRFDFYNVPEAYLVPEYQHKLQLIPVYTAGDEFKGNVRRAQLLGIRHNLPINMPTHLMAGWDQ